MQKLVDRKPKVNSGEVIATELGWVHVKPNGSEELLVSATGLKSFIDSQRTEKEVVSEEVVEEVVEEQTAEQKTKGRKAKAS